MTIPTGRRTGRPPLTDRDTLMSAALRLGFPATVGAVTKAVGVKYSTFYRHFPTIATLTAACVDVRLDEGMWPDPLDASDWHTYLSEVAATLVALLNHYSHLDEALLSVALDKYSAAPRRLDEAAAHGAARLHAAGLDDDAAERGAWAVIHAATHPGITTAARRHDAEFALDGIAHRLEN